MKHRKTILLLILLAALIAASAIALWKYDHRTRVIVLEDLTYPFDTEHGTIDDIPQSIRNLDGKTVAIEGGMVPLDQAEQISHFALVPPAVYELNRPPNLQQVIVCNTPQGRSLSYQPNPIRVTGKLRVRVELDAGFIVSLYSMDVTSVQPVVPATPPTPIAKWKIAAAAASALAVTSALWVILRKWRRQRRRFRLGLCLSCGYDLRFSPDRCPECGTKCSPGREDPLLMP